MISAWLPRSNQFQENFSHGNEEMSNSKGCAKPPGLTARLCLIPGGNTSGGARAFLLGPLGHFLQAQTHLSVTPEFSLLRRKSESQQAGDSIPFDSSLPLTGEAVPIFCHKISSRGRVQSLELRFVFEALWEKKFPNLDATSFTFRHW